MDKIQFAQLTFEGLRKNELLKFSGHCKVIIPTNAEIIVHANEDRAFKEAISKFILTFDGEVPLKLARRKYPMQKIEKLNGSDIIYSFCEYASAHNNKIFLLGGREVANSKSVNILSSRYDIGVKGFSPKFAPYPFEKSHNEEILKKLEAYKPDILFVGFGVPKQEYWINDNYEVLKKLGIKFIIACGGTFEFVSGYNKRAPMLIQKLCLEIIFRLIIEPKKLRLKRLFKSIRIFKYI